jgi:succinyl-CoA synthetase beta subunit
MAALRRTGDRMRPGPVSTDVNTTMPQLPPGEVVTEWAGTPVLDWAGVGRPHATLIAAVADLPAAVAAMGGHAVLKVQSPDVTHKSELGAVRVGITESEAAAAGAEMIGAVKQALPTAAIEGILVQALCAPGVELLVGLQAGGSGFPPTITVGMGGTGVEIYRDVASAFAPLDEDSADRLISTLRGSVLLDGFRGRPRADRQAAARAVAAFSHIARIPGFIEAEINPLIVHADGATAADLVIRKKEN